MSPGLGCTVWDLDTSLLRTDPHACDIPSHMWVASPGMWVLIRLCLSHSYQSQGMCGACACVFIYILSCSVQLLSPVRLFETPWIAARQASLSITKSWSPLKPMSIEPWFYPAISSSVFSFCSCPQSLPASGSFPMSQLFAARGKSKEFQFQHQSFQWTPRTDLL